MTASLYAHVSLLALALSSGCSSPPSPRERLEVARHLAEKHGWKESQLHTGRFSVDSWAAASEVRSSVLTVYVEGDGLAWVNRTKLSQDPTPVNPVALKLALAQTDGTAVYLARPCQYRGIADNACVRRYWSTARFSLDVIFAMNNALDQLKMRYGAKQLQLVGYSGGGAITGLLAARRADVTRWITVAGNLDPHAWARYHRVSELNESDSPMDYRAKLASIKQWHFVGDQDNVMPPTFAKGFASGLPDALVTIVEGFDHNCCWAERWGQLSRGVVGSPP